MPKIIDIMRIENNNALLCQQSAVAYYVFAT